MGSWAGQGHHCIHTLCTGQPHGKVAGPKHDPLFGDFTVHYVPECSWSMQMTTPFHCREKEDRVAAYSLKTVP